MQASDISKPQIVHGFVDTRRMARSRPPNWAAEPLRPSQEQADQFLHLAERFLRGINAFFFSAMRMRTNSAFADANSASAAARGDRRCSARRCVMYFSAALILIEATIGTPLDHALRRPAGRRTDAHATEMRRQCAAR